MSDPVFVMMMVRAQLCPTLCDSTDCSPRDSSIHGISLARISGLPFPPPGDLPNPGIEPESPTSPALQTDSLPLSHQRSLFGCKACGILVPRPGIESRPLTVKALNPNHWTTRELPIFKKSNGLVFLLLPLACESALECFSLHPGNSLWLPSGVCTVRVRKQTAGPKHPESKKSGSGPRDLLTSRVNMTMGLGAQRMGEPA